MNKQTALFEKVSGLFSHLNEIKEKKKDGRVSLFISGEKGKYFLQRATLNSLFKLPGGGIDPGESHEDAAARILHEDFGVSKSVSKKHLKYLGTHYNGKTANEHYYLLHKHNIHEGKYLVNGNPKEPINISEVEPTSENYRGPDIDRMMHYKKAGLFDSIKKLIGNKNEATVPLHTPDDSKVPLPTVEDGPYFRFVSLNNGNPIGLHTAANALPAEDDRRKSMPDSSWIPSSKAQGESYWTQHGLKKYLNSGLYDWHRGAINDDMAVMVAKKPKKKKHSDEHQIIVDPKETQPDDMYYLDHNRVKPLSANELISRYSSPITKQAVDPKALVKGVGGWLGKQFSREGPAIAKSVAPAAERIIPSAVSAATHAAPQLGAKALADFPNLSKGIPPAAGHFVPPQLLRPTTPTAAPSVSSIKPEPLPVNKVIDAQPGTWKSDPDNSWLSNALGHTQDQLRYASGLKAGQPFWSGIKPITATSKLLMSPKYPVIEPWLKQHGLGVIPRVARGASVVGGAAAGAMTGNALLYGVPKEVTNNIAAQGLMTEDERDRAYDKIKGVNMLKHYWRIADPRNNDPLTNAVRDGLKSTVVETGKYENNRFRQDNPNLMNSIDAARSMSPVGLASTLYARNAVSDTKPDMAKVMIDSFDKHAPSIINNPSKVWNAPIRKTLTEDIFDKTPQQLYQSEQYVKRILPNDYNTKKVLNEGDTEDSRNYLKNRYETFDNTDKYNIGNTLYKNAPSAQEALPVLEEEKIKKLNLEALENWRNRNELKNNAINKKDETLKQLEKLKNTPNWFKSSAVKEAVNPVAAGEAVAPVVKPVVQGIGNWFGRNFGKGVTSGTKALPAAEQATKSIVPSITQVAPNLGAKALADFPGLSKGIPQATGHFIPPQLLKPPVPPAPTAEPAKSFLGKINDHLKWTADIKPETSWLSKGVAKTVFTAPDLGPLSKSNWMWKAPSQAFNKVREALSPYRAAIGQAIPTPIKALGNLALRPQYPLEATLKRNWLGSLPAAARASSAVAGGVSLSTLGHSAIYGVPDEISKELVNNKVIPEDQRERVRDSLSGANAGRAYWNIITGKSDPVTNMYRGVVQDAWRPMSQYHNKLYSDQNPDRMRIINTLRSFTPAGAATTAFARDWKSDQKPDLPAIANKNFANQAHAIAANPREALSNPLTRQAREVFNWQDENPDVKELQSLIPNKAQALQKYEADPELRQGGHQLVDKLLNNNKDQLQAEFNKKVAPIESMMKPKPPIDPPEPLVFPTQPATTSAAPSVAKPITTPVTAPTGIQPAAKPGSYKHKFID